MEDPKTAKTIVRREVTRVLTPGTAVDAALDASESQWLASIAANGNGPGAAVGVAALDLSTGEFRATEFPGPSAWALALDELARMRPAEVLYARGSAGFGGTSQSVRQGVLRDPAEAREAAAEEPAQLDISGARTEVEEWAFTEDYAVPLLRQQLQRALAGRHGAGRSITRLRWLRGRLCITCARPSRGRWSIWTRCGTTSATTRWSWMR